MFRRPLALLLTMCGVALLVAQDAAAQTLPPLLSSLNLDSSFSNLPAPFEIARYQSAIAGSLQDNGSVPDGEASISVGFGFGKLSARSIKSADTALIPGLYGNGAVSASFSDRFVINPADVSLIGSAGSFKAILHVVGEAGAREPSEWIGTAGQARATYGIDIVFSNNPRFSIGGRWDSVEDGGTEFVGQLPGDLEVDVAFVFGQPIDLAFKASATTKIGGGTIQGSGQAFIDINTIQWQGISELRDASGGLVDGYSVSSDSGTDWARAVPEPNAVLLGFGVWVLLSARFTKRKS